MLEKKFIGVVVYIDKILELKRKWNKSGYNTLEEWAGAWRYGSGADLIQTLFKDYVDNTETQTSVNTYGGFYIGRYEGGDGVATQVRNVNSDSTLVSKKDVYIYNCVNFNDAKTKAESMYSNITSKLISGAGWDRTLNWIVETGNKTEKEVFENSSSWGNYKDSTGSAQTNSGEANMNFKTGRNEAWKANNIYDLAGNVEEWTDEANSSGRASYRGGLYNGYGSGYPAFDRFGYDFELSNNALGFRVALYLWPCPLKTKN